MSESRPLTFSDADQELVAVEQPSKSAVRLPVINAEGIFKRDENRSAVYDLAIVTIGDSVQRIEDGLQDVVHVCSPLFLIRNHNFHLNLCAGKR
jgi:hypothetical protein